MVHELDISQIIHLLDTSLWRVGGAYFKASIESEGGWDRSVGLSCVPTWISRIYDVCGFKWNFSTTI